MVMERGSSIKISQIWIRASLRWAKISKLVKRDVAGIISIHVGDLLISGEDMFVGYIAYRMKEKSTRVDMGKTNRPIWARKSLK